MSGDSAGRAVHRFLEGRVVAVQGDLVAQAVDAIVNAANGTLLGGGGVDGAIHAAGGPAILEECHEIRRTMWPDGLPTGEAVITGAGRLPAKHVIHTVGPIYERESGREAALLSSCYRRSVEIAQEHALESLAFPAISTGAFGYPPEEAAGIASRAIERALARAPVVREVRLVFFARYGLDTFVLHQAFGSAAREG